MVERSMDGQVHLKKLMVRSLILTCLLAGPSVAVSKYPIMSGDTSSPECSEAFALATSMFNSTNPRLYAPLVIPKEVHSTLAFYASEYTGPYKYAFVMNEKSFDKYDHNERCVTFHSARNAKNGKRIILKDISCGWRGNIYTLYFADANQSQEDVIADINKNDEESTVFKLRSSLNQSPIIFEGKAHNMWFIDVGEPDEIMPNWSVYTEGTNDFKEVCTIKLRPDGERGFESLPPPVRKLAFLLDETLIPGYEEGTLQQTRLLRVRAKYIWANVALRPWALSEQSVYNSTEEVESGLLQWSKKAPSFRRHYKKILNTYPSAENALTRYYMRQFKLKKESAKELSHWALNIAFRGNYTFHATEDGMFRYDDINTNPWLRSDFKH